MEKRKNVERIYKVAKDAEYPQQSKQQQQPGHLVHSPQIVYSSEDTLRIGLSLACLQCSTWYSTAVVELEER